MKLLEKMGQENETSKINTKASNISSVEKVIRKLKNQKKSNEVLVMNYVTVLRKHAKDEDIEGSFCIHMVLGSNPTTTKRK